RFRMRGNPANLNRSARERPSTRGRGTAGSSCMAPLKAHVKNSRLTLDEPTHLPEGQVVYLQPLDELEVVDRDGDDLDETERAALHAELEASIAEAERGETEDFARVLSELRQQR